MSIIPKHNSPAVPKDFIVTDANGNQTRLGFDDVKQLIGGGEHETTTVTIAVADWSGGTTCTKTVEGVTADNLVFCEASDPSVKCTAQAENSLTFTAEETPTENVTVKVVIFE